uniref:Zinc finger CCHC domain-containing protein 9 n=1 Tax=Cacopsylla melanoneura TaxID=428564 RepID=A0A8D8W6X2_9HEMI
MSKSVEKEDTYKEKKTLNTNENNENGVVKSGKKKTSQEQTQRSSDLKDSTKNSHQVSNNSGNGKNKKEFKVRKKPQPQPYQMDINGEMVDIVTYDGFPIMKEDAKRLDELKKSLFAKGIPRAEIKKIMKLQRRNAEKALSRAKKRVCFNCRRSGHNLSECPVLNKGEGTGICFKCGSTEHTHFECKVVKKQDYKFAQCFICKEQGHISNQCPDNPRGLYPKGGACKLCGDVTHLKRFCPTLPKESEPTIDEFLDIEGENKQRRNNTPNTTPKKHVVF